MRRHGQLTSSSKRMLDPSQEASQPTVYLGLALAELRALALPTPADIAAVNGHSRQSPAPRAESTPKGRSCRDKTQAFSGPAQPRRQPSSSHFGSTASIREQGRAASVRLRHDRPSARSGDCPEPPLFCFVTNCLSSTVRTAQFGLRPKRDQSRTQLAGDPPDRPFFVTKKGGPGSPRAGCRVGSARLRRDAAALFAKRIFGDRQPEGLGAATTKKGGFGKSPSELAAKLRLASPRRRQPYRAFSAKCQNQNFCRQPSQDDSWQPAPLNPEYCGQMRGDRALGRPQLVVVSRRPVVDHTEIPVYRLVRRADVTMVQTQHPRTAQTVRGW